jgi:hypothetical protein
VIVRFSKRFAGARFGDTRFTSCLAALGTFAASDLATASAAAAAAAKIAPRARVCDRSIRRSPLRLCPFAGYAPAFDKLPFLMDR